MDYVIVAFRSRTQTMHFGEGLRLRGIPYEIINTPRQAYVGCGLSVKANKKYLPIIRRLVYSKKLDGFAGIFVPTYSNDKLTLKSL